jgi:hypothetical protein
MREFFRPGCHFDLAWRECGKPQARNGSRVVLMREFFRPGCHFDLAWRECGKPQARNGSRVVLMRNLIAGVA